ncbi:Wadjet anti-phage system protein JetD domain-containing protein [Burkholderia dolosa]|uniref:Wadjet anti-phage system protein JetD domain-containing protein n=1 Tax=Burkholderia dolosa TaxID=152500 RepID=UPI001C9787B5|nr:Wadjet anti-phage system protein JetD domain-containing protein [Burkholderia dolosa]MBY4833601.1 hypothetical protein [Burkholderia dolosa]
MTDGFLQAFRTGRRKRVLLADLRRHWLDAHPEQLQHPERDALLLAALRELEAQGRLALPARGSFEQLGNPPMPKFVTLLDQGEVLPSEDWSRISWLPELGFWTDLTTSELVTAKAINEWLLRRRGKFLQVPLRERSLEIFGDEKYLDLRVRQDALFSGRLPLASIGAFLVPHPLPYRAANAPGRSVLVVENHHTYWSLAEWNMHIRRYAAVVYGAGKAFCSSGPALQEAIRECRADGALYFGDLDPAGISIPLRFNDANGVTVLPAVDLYRFAVSHGKRRAPVARASNDENDARRWLPELCEQICSLWDSGYWIPQESLGTEQLFSNWDVDPALAAPRAEVVSDVASSAESGGHALTSPMR